MAQTQKKYDIPSEFQYKYKADYESDWTIHRQYIMTFDPLEAMLMGSVYDTVSKSIDGARITDGYATTLAKERADRVAAKLPDGNTESVYKAEVGKAMFMDILRQKWIYPNANAQHSFKEKLNMWDFYSSVYGYFPMFYDWNVSANGYSGPDCWLWNPRYLVPQQGRVSITDMEYITALTFVNKGFLQDMVSDAQGISESKEEAAAVKEGTHDVDANESENPATEGGWDVEALKLLVGMADNTSNPDPTRDSLGVRERLPMSQKRGVLLATRYEAGYEGEWITFAPDYGCIEVRRLKNPHKNGRIPFIIKYCQPLFDSFYGLGDFQRAKPLQFARDGLTNFYFKGIKMNLIPPVVANANGVLKHTLDYREGAVMLETIPNSIRRLETSTAGLATYQAAQDALTGSLLSMFGSQNASISSSASNNPSQGKTPQAIDLYSSKEADRDGAQLRHLEDAIEQLTDGFYSLISNIGTEKIPVSLFAEDIQDIYDAGGTDVKELFKNFKKNGSNTAGVLTIDPKQFRNLDLRFKINPDSTAMVNKQAIKAAIEEFLATLGKFQNILTEDPGVTVHWDEIMKTYEMATGIPNASKFMSFDPKASVEAKQQAIQAQNAPKQTNTQIQMPNGQIHESADLGRLYLNTEDWWIKNQILISMGFQPAPPEVQSQITQSAPDNADTEANKPMPPTTISTGHTFNDPNIAAAAEAIHGHQPPAPAAAPAPPPTVTSSGHAFNDATIGQAAEAIHKTGSETKGAKSNG